MKWTLRKRILLGYGVTLLLAALVFVWGLANLFRLGRASAAILSENYQSIVAAERMIGAIELHQSATLLNLLGYADQGKEELDRATTDFAQWLERARGNLTIDGEAEILAEIEERYDDYLSATKTLLSEGARPPESSTASYFAVEAVGSSAREACVQLLRVNEAAMEMASSRANALAIRAVWSVGAVGLLSLLFGLVFSLALSNRLAEPIRRLGDASRSVAEGDYDVSVDTDYKANDELAILAAQFNEMTSKLRSYRDLNMQRIVAQERKSEAVIQSIHDGLILVGTSGEIEEINPVAARALDTERAAATGQPFRDIIGSAHISDAVLRCLRSGEGSTIEGDDVTIPRDKWHPGEYFEFAVSPVYSPNGMMLGVIVLMRNVTKLKELDRLKDHFVATASHELRTPLTSIGMSIGLLQEVAGAKLDHRETKLLSAAREDLGRLVQLVNDLLDLSNIQAGRIPLKIEKVTVQELFETATHMFSGHAAELGVALRYDEPGETTFVRADANKIVWVLTNLISNALRHTNRGGEVTLAALPAGAYVHISVTDDGEGIPYQFQGSIFDKFVQVASRKTAGGSGLGLSISREIVKAHGGTIWVESDPGQGSIFTFSIPAA